MSKPPENRQRFPVLRFRRFEIVLGSKVWAIVALAAAIIAIGVLVTPRNFWAGIGVGVAGILGAALGAMFQATPVPRNFISEGSSAVRGLLRVAEDVEDAQGLATQLAHSVPENERMTLGLINVQDRLRNVRVSLYVAMSEWNAVAPGALDDVNRLRNAGIEALKLLSKEAEDEF